MDLNLIRTLVDIVEAGSLSEAARRRQVTRSQLSKELKSLERQLDTTLLRRTTRRIEPTAAGLTLVEHGQRMLAEVDAARAAIDSLGQGARGHVRLSIPTGLGEVFLGDRLLDFQRAHPAVSLRVLYSNRVTDLIGAEVDIAVRVTSDPPPEQVARELCAIHWGLYATPGYLAGMPALQSPDDLAGIRLLCTPPAEAWFRLVMAQGDDERVVRLRPFLQSEHFPFLRRAMLAGHGVALLPAYALADDVRAGRAVRVLPAWQARGLGRSLYILTMPERRPSHAARVLTDYLREALAPLDDIGLP